MLDWKASHRKMSRIIIDEMNSATHKQRRSHTRSQHLDVRSNEYYVVALAHHSFALCRHLIRFRFIGVHAADMHDLLLRYVGVLMAPGQDSQTPAV